MKFGPRKVNIKNRLKGRTTAKVKRQVLSAVNPLHGKKGWGFFKSPKKSVKNTVYKKTTFGLFK